MRKRLTVAEGGMPPRGSGETEAGGEKKNWRNRVAGIDTVSRTVRIDPIDGPPRDAGTGWEAGEKRLFDTSGPWRKWRGGTNSTDSNSKNSRFTNSGEAASGLRVGPESCPRELTQRVTSGLSTEEVAVLCRPKFQSWLTAVCVRQVKQGKWEPESDRVVRSWATACFPVAVLPTGDAILWCCGPVAELPISRVTAWEVARLHGVQAGEDWARGRDESGACRARVASARREASSGGVFSAA